MAIGEHLAKAGRAHYHVPMSETLDTVVESAPIEPSGEVTPESIVEALLFSTDQALSARKIAQLLGVGDARDVNRHVESLNARYEAGGSSFRIEMIAKGFRMLTLPVYHPWLGKLHKTRAESRLSAAALETLAVVAYKQPALRADVEAVRGVAVGDMLVRLREMNLVRIVGRAEEIGRPLLYGTTTKFLEVFGLRSVEDLPKLDPNKPNAIPSLRIADESKDADAPDESSDETAADETDAG